MMNARSPKVKLPGHPDRQDTRSPKAAHGLPVQVDELGRAAAPVHEFDDYGPISALDGYDASTPVRADRASQFAAGRCDHRARWVCVMAHADASLAVPACDAGNGGPLRWSLLINWAYSCLWFWRSQRRAWRMRSTTAEINDQRRSDRDERLPLHRLIDGRRVGPKVTNRRHDKRERQDNGYRWTTHDRATCA